MRIGRFGTGEHAVQDLQQAVLDVRDLAVRLGALSLPAVEVTVEAGRIRTGLH